MTTDYSLPGAFGAVKDDDEEILWVGKPNFTAFVTRGIPFLCIGIRDPYAVFKKIKEVTVDIKTDWNYPNAMRPDFNPGYNTKYERK